MPAARKPHPTCIHCGAALVLRQPNEADYIRLLAVCP